MASFALGIAGSAAFGPVGGFVGSAIGAVIDSFIFGPDDQTVEGRRIDDTRLSGSTYGWPIRKFWGTGRVGGNIDWCTGLIEHRQETTEGSKGSGPSVTTVTWIYTTSLGITWAEGPAEAVVNLYLDKKLAQDNSVTGATTGALLGIFLGGGAVDDIPGNPAVRHYLGTETQLPDPAEQADKGVANTSAYRGRVRSVLQDLTVTPFGNRIPQIEAVIAKTAVESKPLISLAPGTPAEAWRTAQMILVPHLARAVSGVTGKVGIVDLQGHTMLASKDLALRGTGATTMTIAVDSNGNVFGFTGVTTITKYDGLTLDAIVSKDVSPIDTGQQNFHMMAAGAPPFETIVVLYASGDNFRKWIGIIDAASLIKINAWSLGVGFDAFAMCRDRDNKPWIAYHDTNGSPEQTYLIQINPRSGAIEQSFSIGLTSMLAIGYEPNTHSIVFFDTAALHRFRIDTGTIDASLTQSFDNVAFAPVWLQGPDANGHIWLTIGNTSFIEIDLVEMSVVQSLANNDWGAGLSTIDGSVYDPLNNAIIRHQQVGGGLRWFFLNRFAGESSTCKIIVDDICAANGLGAAVIVTSALVDEIPYYSVDARMPGRRALEPLARACGFRSVESDFKIKFPKRGAGVSFAIPEEYLGARTSFDEAALDGPGETRRQELELPWAVDVKHFDPDQDYLIGTQRAQMAPEAVRTERQVTFTFPGALTTQQAHEVAERILYTDEVNRTRYDDMLSPRYLKIDPADVGTITKDGAVHTLEVDEANWGADGRIDLRGAADDAIAHIAEVSGVAALGVPVKTILPIGQLAFHLLDIPLLRDQDDQTGLYVGAGSFGPASSPGMTIVKSNDEGASFTIPFASISGVRNLAHGAATTALATASPRVWDRVNSVTVKMFREELTSDTELNVIRGSRAILLGGEIVFWATSVDHGDDTYTLSNLIRARLGTDWALDGHVIGERVVVLDAATLQREAVPIADLNVEKLYKGVTVGNPLSAAATKALTFGAVSQRNPAPFDVRASRDGSPMSWTITWRRRNRALWEIIEGQAPPLVEPEEKYIIEFYDTSGSPETLAGSYTASSESFSYSEAQQIADFGAEQDTLTAEISQVNTAVGATFKGFIARVVVDKDNGVTSWMAKAA